MKSKKLIIILSVAFILEIVVFGSIFSHLQKRLGVNKQQKNELNNLEKKLQTLEGFDKNVIMKRVIKMEGVFPSDKPIVQLLSSLTQLAGKHSLSFGGVSLSPGSLTKTDEKKAKTDLSDLSFGFEVEGVLNNILMFLKELERVAPLMKIDKVGLTIKTNSLISAEINVSAFYQAPPELLGKVSQPVKLLSRDEEVILNKLFSFTQFQAVLPVTQTGKTNLFDFGP